MPFQFQWLCELLEDLEKNQYRHVISSAPSQSYERRTIYTWYEKFDHKIERTGASALAFLSCLFPERRPDRTYNLQQKRLSQILGRALGLGASRAAELNNWLAPDGEDFAKCVERVMCQSENVTPSPERRVTLEEVDECLDQIAARSPSSSPSIRAKKGSASVTELLRPILHRLQSHEAKWFVRMLLKRYSPVQIPEFDAMHGFHFMLPNLLIIQNSLEAAVHVFAKKAIRFLPPRPDKNYESALQVLVAEHVQPEVGVMIKRQPYLKARSIKHCCSIANKRQMSVERKYDGEYCQIHVDRSRGAACIQIFSKSGRDSTDDRASLHVAIRDALRLNRSDCKIRNRCIIEGELLVWSSTTRQILPFYKIRRYVKHGGRTFGTTMDSPPKADENLMIAFYDILLLDSHMLLTKTHTIRRQHLKTVLHTTKGRAILGERLIIDFASKTANEELRNVFAEAITQRWEGLVLKASHGPYFTWGRDHHGIKMKKDYIAGLGDTADLCIIGACRDSQSELEIGLGNLRWTTFHIGAVYNKQAMQRFGARPLIKIIDVLTHHSMPDTELIDLNSLGKLCKTAYSPSIEEYDVEIVCKSIPKPTELFKKPFIVEVMGAGFEKLPDSPYYTLRFPRKVGGKVKIHTDRELTDTMSFSELQNNAKQSLQVSEANFQEDAEWITRLINADGRHRQITDVSQETHPSRKIINDSDMNLHPIDSRIISSPVFVRPDTEEPEVWGNHGTFSSPRGRDDPDGSSKTMLSVLSTIAVPRTQGQCRSAKGAEAGRTSGKKRKASLDLSTSSDRWKRHPPHALKSSSTSEQREKCSARAIEGSSGHVINGSLQALQTKDAGSPVEFYTPDEICDGQERCREGQRYSLATPGSSELGVSMVIRPPSSSTDASERCQKAIISTTRNALRSLQSTAHDSHQHSSRLQEKSDRKTFVKTIDKQDSSGLSERATPVKSISTSAGFLPRDLVLETLARTIISRQSPSLSPILILPHLIQIKEVVLNLDLKISFTSSIKHFLNQISSSNRLESPYFVILVDVTNSRQTARALRALAREIESHVCAQDTSKETSTSATSFESAQNAITDDKRFGCPVEPAREDEAHKSQSLHHTNRYLKFNDRIILFDHHILQHTSIVQTGDITLAILRQINFQRPRGGRLKETEDDTKLFCGVLHLSSPSPQTRTGRGEKRGKSSIRLETRYDFAWLTTGI